MRTGQQRLSSGALPRDSNGVYFVLTLPKSTKPLASVLNTAASTPAPLWAAPISSTHSSAILIAAPAAAKSRRTGPNSPAADVGGADGMANVMSHELEEAISDPDLNAWFDSSGQENADKCNFNFGATSTCNRQGFARRRQIRSRQVQPDFGSNDWMLQQNWRNSGGGACAQHL